MDDAKAKVTTWLGASAGRQLATVSAAVLLLTAAVGGAY